MDLSCIDLLKCERREAGIHPVGQVPGTAFRFGWVFCGPRIRLLLHHPIGVNL
jgi:hypothetical protein